MRHSLGLFLIGTGLAFGSGPPGLGQVLRTGIDSVELTALRLTEVWQYGEGIDSVQQGVQILRFRFDPVLFSAIKPVVEDESGLESCAIACGPNYGHLEINGKHRFSAPCGFNEKRDTVRVVERIGPGTCRKTKFGFGGKKVLISVETLPLTPENRKRFMLKPAK